MSEAIPHEAVLQRFPEVEWDEEFGTLIVPTAIATEVAIWLRDDDAFRIDYCSNVTGIDYLDREFKEKVKIFSKLIKDIGVCREMCTFCKKMDDCKLKLEEILKYDRGISADNTFILFTEFTRSGNVIL